MSKISAEDQHALSTDFRSALDKAFSEKFQVVSIPGPGVMKLQVAVVDAESATPGLRTISLVLPQARLLTMAGSAATGTQLFAGALQVGRGATRRTRWISSRPAPPRICTR